jgi:hypothetical protein
MTETLNTVWQQTRYDSGLYICAVVRDGDSGRLTITLDGNIPHLLHEEKVKVERTDTDNWRRRCEAVINNPDLRTIERR